jgi:hypothetical protein
MDILFKDELRASVETASGGKQTVLRTAKGQATYMNIIQQVRLEDLRPSLGTGPHPAFVVGGVEKSEIFIGTYQAVVRNGEALSLPGQAPAGNINFDGARAACCAAGAGFHLLTNYEWALLALLCTAAGHDVRGNTGYGNSHSHPEETGTRTGTGGIVLTGSGPDSWRHDGTPYGIADLAGNVWEWCDGLKLSSGQIVMPIDNDFNLAESEWPATGTCIDLVNGLPVISSEVTHRGWNGRYFKDVTVAPGFEVNDLVKQALLCPLDAAALPGCFWIDNREGFEALPIRGGGWSNVSNAGLGALNLNYVRSDANSHLGFRPAFIG